MHQARRIARIVPHRAVPDTEPIPNNAPHATCVVDTGRPIEEADATSEAVTAATTAACPAFNAVMLKESVSATRRDPKRPPAAITKATDATPRNPPSAGATARSAAIFGVSFMPRKNPTHPDASR